LQQLGRDLGIAENMKWVGNLRTLESLCDCYCASDVFVFASRTETKGLVLLEAMPLGVPVVSTARMGTVDIPVNGQGALVVDEDEVDFCVAILKLLADRELYQQLSHNGREHAKTCSASAMAMHLEGVYMETVESTSLFDRDIGSSEAP
jgi:1,2-diacylglycerol 3-alpha-glucosyltransferase